MARAYVIPGFRQPKRMYTNIARAFDQQGFVPVILRPKWNFRVMSDYITEVEQQLPARTDHDVIFGFSFGAYIAFELGQRHRFRHQFLCSTSPYFQELLPTLPKTWKRVLGKKRLIDFQQYRWRAIAKNNNNQITLFCGDSEGRVMTNFSTLLSSSLQQPLLFVPGVRHVIQDPKYTELITAQIKKTTYGR